MPKLLTTLVRQPIALVGQRGALNLKVERNEKELHSVFAVNCSTGCGGSDTFRFGHPGAEYKFVNHVYGTDANASQSLSATMRACLPQVPACDWY